MFIHEVQIIWLLNMPQHGTRNWVRYRQLCTHSHTEFAQQYQPNCSPYINGMGTPTKYFENLLTNELYNIDISLVIVYRKTGLLVFNRTLINFTSSGPRKYKHAHNIHNVYYFIHVIKFFVSFNLLQLRLKVMKATPVTMLFTNCCVCS